MAYKQAVLYKETEILVRGNCHKKLKRYKVKNSHVEMIPLGFNSAIATMSSSISSLAVGRKMTGLIRAV